MPTHPYQFLNRRGENSLNYRRRLMGFAISYRISKPSHYQHVAEQIVALDLVKEFDQFTPILDINQWIK
ncbi:hypothetical protein GO755_00670 [Spirosoma sp. HMF4905]|uniref:Uncharacterized protein n=1 Tax=Spirosoma arboris TaxID=2682092 RepID=A0A7K1S3X8_9BACT|nr:hypothetical protein [Spirosoma arboris]MVM28524.1 hypothetical protein [Spirosoma arboris]